MCEDGAAGAGAARGGDRAAGVVCAVRVVSAGVGGHHSDRARTFAAEMNISLSGSAYRYPRTYKSS